MYTWIELAGREGPRDWPTELPPRSQERRHVTQRLLPPPTGTRGGSEPFVVLGVRDGLAPLGRSGAVHGHMHERRLGTSTVEMPIVRADVDHVTRLQRVPVLPSRAHAPTTGHAVEELSPRVAVPMGACGR